MDQNEEIFVRFNDAPFQKIVTTWMASEAYRRLRSDEVDHARSGTLPPRPRHVEPQREERYVTCVPLVPLKVAAGAFSDPQHVGDEDFAWTAIETGRRLRPGMFVAQVVGKSMEPAIPDGAYCLFAAPVEGSEIRALASHCYDADLLRGEEPRDRLLVSGHNAFHTFGRSPLR